MSGARYLVCILICKTGMKTAGTFETSQTSLFPIGGSLTLRGCGVSSQNWRIFCFADDERACITSEHRVQIDVFTT